MAAAKKEDFIENCYLAGEINLCWGGGGGVGKISKVVTGRGTPPNTLIEKPLEFFSNTQQCNSF